MTGSVTLAFYNDIKKAMAAAETGELAETGALIPNTSLNRVLKQSFQKFDTNGNGKIDVTELALLLQKLGERASPANLELVCIYIVLYCIILYYIVLHCITLYCMYVYMYVTMLLVYTVYMIYAFTFTFHFNYINTKQYKYNTIQCNAI